MKKLRSYAVIVALALGCLTGCSGSQGGTVATDGSTSMEKVIGALGEDFGVRNPGVTVTYNPTGSGSGIKAVQEGRCDIGLSSRRLKEEEKASGLTETVLAYDGIAIIVHPENPVTDLTMEQIAGIFTGKPAAIGYASLASVKDSVRAVSVNGVAPGEEAVRDGSYAVWRPFVLVTRTDAALSATAQRFFDYATSGEANDMITVAGVVPAN